MSKTKRQPEITLTEKLRLAELGKKLDPAAIELEAMKVYGRKEYRKELAKALGGTTALFSFTFAGKAPYKLYQVSEHLKSISN